MKANANKVRHPAGGKILAGFAGAAADAFTLFEKFEEEAGALSDEPAARRGQLARTGVGPRVRRLEHCSSWRTRSMVSSSAAPAS